MAFALPSPFADYFAADRAGDLGAFVALFAQDAVVIDERRTHTGRAEILAWKTGAAAQYRYTAEPFAIAERDGRTVVTARLTGDFPGSPIDLRYTFTLAAGRITGLEIAP